jgi:PAS domain S-box-containing protein
VHQQNGSRDAAVDAGKGRLEYQGKRAVLLDVAGGLYSLKKTLRADIGFFEKDFMFRAGLEGARSFLSSLSDLQIPADHRQAIEMLLSAYSQRGFGEFKLERVDIPTKTVEISCTNSVEAGGYLENKDRQAEPICAYTPGILSWICSLALSPGDPYELELAVHETECSAQGKEACHYVVGPQAQLSRQFTEYRKPDESITEHELRLNEEILVKNLELQSVNLALERQIRKRTEELWKAEENYKSLMRLSPDTIAVILPNGRIHSVNEAGAKFLGVDSNLEGESLMISSLMSAPGSSWERILWALEKEGSVTGLETFLKRADGSVATMLLEARFADLLPGRCVEAVFRDITASRVMERKMEEVRTEAEFLNDLLSHDIMNYTFSALHFLKQLWKAQGLTEEERRQMSIVTKDVEGAHELCTSVRDLSRIKTAEEEELLTSDLDRLLAESFEECKMMFPGRSIVINFSAGSNRMVRCSSLGTRLFANLLTNAVKYDQHTEAVVDVQVDEYPQAGVAYWRIRISDNGKGIPQEEKERIFERFHRLDASVPGTGLGLFVARFIADASGGKAWAEDRVPGDHTMGTTMVVLLPKAVGSS